MCSYFFCPVEKLAVMNRKLLEKKTSVCNENANYSGFILPNKFRLKFGSFSKSWINDAKCEKKNEIGSCAKTYFTRKQKFGQLGWSEWFLSWITSTTKKLEKPNLAHGHTLWVTTAIQFQLLDSPRIEQEHDWSFGWSTVCDWSRQIQLKPQAFRRSWNVWTILRLQ